MFCITQYNQYPIIRFYRMQHYYYADFSYLQLLQARAVPQSAITQHKSKGKFPRGKPWKEGGVGPSPLSVFHYICHALLVLPPQPVHYTFWDAVPELATIYSRFPWASEWILMSGWAQREFANGHTDCADQGSTLQNRSFEVQILWHVGG